MTLYASFIFMKQYSILHQTLNSNRWKESNKRINRDDDDYYDGGDSGCDDDDDDVALNESWLTLEIN
jgi:hypothetical protein